MFGQMIASIFFFQAEDGIRDSSVTGVQTCALPISMIRLLLEARDADTGEPLDDVALRNEAAVIFMAGHPTKAKSLPPGWGLPAQAPGGEKRPHPGPAQALPRPPPAPHEAPRPPYTQ